jgi:hypothetical protein
MRATINIFLETVFLAEYQVTHLFRVSTGNLRLSGVATPNAAGPGF